MLISIFFLQETMPLLVNGEAGFLQEKIIKNARRGNKSGYHA